MNKYTRAAIAGLSLAFVPVSAMAQEQGKVLTPKIQGTQFRIECSRDLENSLPTAQLLGRLDSHIHGAAAPQGDNPNLYEDANRDQILEDLISRLPTLQAAMAKASMGKLFNDYDAAPDKGLYLKTVLEETHGIGDSFYEKISQHCDG